MTLTSSAPSNVAQKTLTSLRRAVNEALERKRRLGQYAVNWHRGAPALLADDGVTEASAIGGITGMPVLTPGQENRESQQSAAVSESIGDYRVSDE